MPISPIYTFDTAVNEILYRIGKRSEVGLGARQNVNRWLNSSQAIFAYSQYDIPELEDTIETFPIVEDINQYDLRTTTPALPNIVGIRTIKNNRTGYMLRRFPWSDYRQLVNQAASDPVRWTRRGHILAIDPIPTTTDTATIEYRRQPTLGVLEVENYQSEWLIDMALYRAWRALQDFSKAKEVLEGLPEMIKALISFPMNQNQWEASYDVDFGIRP